MFVFIFSLFPHEVLDVCPARGSFVYRGIFNCRFGTKTIRIAGHGHAWREAGREIATVKDFTRDLHGDFSQRLCLKLCCSRKWCRTNVLSRRTCKEFRKELKLNAKNRFSRFGAYLRKLSHNEYSDLEGKMFFSL